MIDAKKILKISVVTLLTLIIAGIVAFLIASPILKGQIEEKQTQLATNGIIKETSQKTTPIVEEPTIPETLPNEFNVLLLGVDSNEARENDEYFEGIFRSDTIILAHVNLEQKKAALMSFHRDIKTDLGPEYGDDYKFNAAYALGGIDMMKAEVEEMTGIDNIPYYAIVDMDGLSSFVDAVGGIEVNVPYSFYDDQAGGGLEAGPQTLNGAQTLVFCRARYAYSDMGLGDGDTIRAGNQRSAIKALAKKAIGADVITLLNIAKTAMTTISTNLTTDQIAEIADKMGDEASIDGIVSMMTPTDSAMIDGIWYEILDTERWKIVLDCFNNFKEVPDAVVEDACDTLNLDWYPGYSPDSEYYNGQAAPLYNDYSDITYEKYLAGEYDPAPVIDTQTMVDTDGDGISDDENSYVDPGTAQ